MIFLFLNQNICCGYSKELSEWDGSFEHPKHMLKIMDKKTFTILRRKFLFVKFFFYFSTNTYVVGTQKNHLNEMVLLSTQNIC